MIKHHLAWGEKKYPIIWSNNPYIWSDVYVLIEEAIGAASSGVFEEWQKKHPEKKKKLIKLLCIVDHETYKQEKYKRDDISLTTKDIKLLEDKLLPQVKLKIELQNKPEENNV